MFLQFYYITDVKLVFSVLTDVSKIRDHRNKIKTKWMQQITVFIDLQDQLNMFRAIFCPSSGT
jgi:hypothetical protein